MNSRLYSLPVKTAAVILFVVTVIITGLFGVAFIYMCSGAGYYSSADADDAFYDSELCSSLAYDEYNNILGMVLDTSNEQLPTVKSNIESNYSFSSGNVAAHVIIKDMHGNVLAEIGELPEIYGDYVNGTQTYFLDDVTDYRTVEISVYVRDPLIENGDSFSEYKRYSDLFFSIRYTAVAVMAVGSVAVVALYVYLMKSAGRKFGETGVTESYIDRIPYDIYLTAVILLFAFILSFLSNWLFDINISYSANNLFLFISLTAISAIPLLLLFVAFSATTAVRVKKRTLFRNTLIWRFCKFIGKIFSVLWRGLRDLCSMLPQTVRMAFLFPCFMLLNLMLIIMCANSTGFGTFIILLMIAALNLTVYFYAIRIVYELVRLRFGSEQLASGKIEYKFNEQKLHGEARKISQNLNRLGDGLSVAVEQRSKSERMKAELITNVSHDLKTPITSIINYVDLLKKEPMQTAASIEYLAVLDRQSARLRKLTTDLIEASKASTGNVEVTLAPTDICELLNQSAAEYTDRFASAGLTPVIRTPSEPIIVSADGKLLWRVLDNLLSNICKYSQSGTRVYLDAASGEQFACVSMRNISSVQLSVTPDELTERFVRGDSSRSGEGSGLGLSIARSLTELQGGKLTLDVDGDLFKVIITFPVVPLNIGDKIQS